MAQTVIVVDGAATVRARLALAAGLAVCLLLCTIVIAGGPVSAAEPDAESNMQGDRDGDGNVSPDEPNADVPPTTAEQQIAQLVMAWRAAVLEADGEAYLALVDAKMVKTFADELKELQDGARALNDDNRQRRIPGWGERTFGDLLTMTPADLVTVYLEGLTEKYLASVQGVTGVADVVLGEDGMSATFAVEGGMAEPPRQAVLEQGEWKLKLSSDE